MQDSSLTYYSFSKRNSCWLQKSSFGSWVARKISYHLNDQEELRKYYLQSLSTNLNDPQKNIGRASTNNIIKRSGVQSQKFIGVLVL